MRNALFIAPCFSPSSYPPALRNRIFAMHLETFGWTPLILTVESQFMEEPADPAFEKMIPKDLEVIRARAIPYQWTRKIGFGNLGLRSFYHIYIKAKALIKEKKIDLIFVSSPPWYTFLVGSLLKKKFKIPFVIDYIDPWICAEDRKAPFFSKRFWSAQLARVLDMIAVRNADAVISVSDKINETLKSLYPAQTRKIKPAIPYGIEPSDMEFAKNHPEKISYFDPDDGFCHVSYLGVIWAKVMPTVEALFKALAAFKRKSPGDYQRIRWHFLGTSYALNAPKQVLPIAEKYGIEEVVQEESGRVSYPMTLNILSRSQVLLALGSQDAHYASSKIFACIAARRPIFGIYYDQSSSADLLKGSKNARLITFSDVQPVETKIPEIETVLENFKDLSKSAIADDTALLQECSALRMTERLAHVFNAV